MASLDGSCLCGNVTYSCDGEPVITAVCHCTECQKQTGTSFSIIVGVLREDLHVNGDSLASMTTIGSDSHLPVSRRFCNQCGSPIVSLPEMTPDLAFIKAGTLEDRSWLKPEMEAWCDSAQPWVAHDTESRGCFARGVPTD
jgi:hypothetical protein